MRCNNCIHYDVCYQYDIIGEDDSEMCALYEQKRPHGEWDHWGSPFSDDSIANSIVCSLCKARYVEIEDEVFNFCPNCGASMKKDGEGKDGNVKEAEAKKCPNCGSDLYEYCFMCCYEGERVKRNE